MGPPNRAWLAVFLQNHQWIRETRSKQLSKKGLNYYAYMTAGVNIYIYKYMYIYIYICVTRVCIYICFFKGRRALQCTRRSLSMHVAARVGALDEFGSGPEGPERLERPQLTTRATNNQVPPPNGAAFPARLLWRCCCCPAGGDLTGSFDRSKRDRSL